MKTNFFNYKKKLIFFLFLICFAVSAENFRVAKLHLMEISLQNKEPSTTSGIFDAIFIKLPSDKTFITGIEVNIKVPQSVATWRDTVAYILYKDVSPYPSEKNIDYSATRISINTIPGRMNHSFYIPISSKFNVKESPYAKILENFSVDSSDGIFLRFILAMKGAPEELESSKLEITAKPVFSNEGYFSLLIDKAQDKKENYSVYIDDTLTQEPFSNLILKTGEHHLSVTSEAYRNEVRSFFVEQAKKTQLKLTLRGIEPVVKIISPENSKVFFDGQMLTSLKEPFTVLQGNHVVKFIIGDYEITKTLNAINGRSYTVNLNIDASITEEE